jgi:hypothetical protein
MDLLCELIDPRVYTSLATGYSRRRERPIFGFLEDETRTSVFARVQGAGDLIGSDEEVAT